MSEVEWRGRSVPVKIDKARIFLLGLADNEAAIAQVSSACFVGGKKAVLLAFLYSITCHLYRIYAGSGVQIIPGNHNAPNSGC